MVKIKIVILIILIINAILCSIPAIWETMEHINRNIIYIFPFIGKGDNMSSCILPWKLIFKWIFSVFVCYFWWTFIF